MLQRNTCLLFGDVLGIVYRNKGSQTQTFRPNRFQPDMYLLPKQPNLWRQPNLSKPNL